MTLISHFGILLTLEISGLLVCQLSVCIIHYALYFLTLINFNNFSEHKNIIIYCKSRIIIMFANVCVRACVCFIGIQRLKDFEQSPKILIGIYM